jgi:hypothetical protein
MVRNSSCASGSTRLNERLAAQGIRTISLADREHVERYGLEDLAGTRGTGPG